MKIIAWDVTGGWNIDQFSAQKGHTIRFITSLKDKEIKSITWSIGQTIKYYQHCIKHVFKASDGNDGEGLVTISCQVVTRKNKRLSCEKTFLIVPKIECQIQFEKRPKIDRHTKYIDLKGQIYCAALMVGNPLNLHQSSQYNPSYSCGGACLESCPEYEVKMTELVGTRISKYGKHKITSQPSLSSNPQTNLTCISLYQNNFLGKNAKYPPLQTIVDIYPEREELSIQIRKVCHKPGQFIRKLWLDGLSKAMLPDKFQIEWKWNKEEKINNCVKQISVSEANLTQKRSITIDFQESGEYDIEVDIFNLTLKYKLLLFWNQDDIIEQN